MVGTCLQTVVRGASAFVAKASCYHPLPQAFGFAVMKYLKRIQLIGLFAVPHAANVFCWEAADIALCLSKSSQPTCQRHRAGKQSAVVLLCHWNPFALHLIQPAQCVVAEPLLVGKLFQRYVCKAPAIEDNALRAARKRKLQMAGH